MKAVSVPAAAPALAPPAAALKLTSDERLARWAAKGSQAAFAVIFERHHQALHRYCHSIVGNGHDAADALQSTMLKALASLPGEQRTIALKPWLYRIAHNESISLLRARRGDSDLDAAAHVGAPAADTVAASRERLRDVVKKLSLTPRPVPRTARRPQTVPVPAAAPDVPSARRAPAPATAPVPAIAPPAASAPVTAAPVAAPAASAVDLANSVTPLRPR